MQRVERNVTGYHSRLVLRCQDARVKEEQCRKKRQGGQEKRIYTRRTAQQWGGSEGPKSGPQEMRVGKRCSPAPPSRETILANDAADARPTSSVSPLGWASETRTGGEVNRLSTMTGLPCVRDEWPKSWRGFRWAAPVFAHSGRTAHPSSHAPRWHHYPEFPCAAW
jgi:hypothetical protein